MEDIKSLRVERPAEDLVKSGHERTWAREYQQIAKVKTRLEAKQKLVLSRFWNFQLPYTKCTC